jgi:hypothetical protein
MKILVIRRIVSIAAFVVFLAQIATKATEAQSAIVNLPRVSQHARSLSIIIGLFFMQPYLSGQSPRRQRGTSDAYEQRRELTRKEIVKLCARSVR